MSTYLRALVDQLKAANGETTRHGWVITKDVFADKYREESNSVGVIGPSDVPDVIRQELERRLEGKPGQKTIFRSAVFDMYVDDDGPGTEGERMCRGILVWVTDDDLLAEPDEEILYSPLGDYGRGNWGCVRISFPGHPDWEIG